MFLSRSNRMRLRGFYESAYGQKHINNIGCFHKQFSLSLFFIWKGTQSVISDF